MAQGWVAAAVALLAQIWVSVAIPADLQSIYSFDLSTEIDITSWEAVEAEAVEAEAWAPASASEANSSLHNP